MKPLPEIKMTQTQKILLQILARALNKETFLLPENTDVAALYAECKNQAVAPMVYSAMTAELCHDPQTVSQWKNHMMCAFQLNLRVQQMHTQLHKLMTQNGISYCIIKGVASALDYPDPLLRAMGDVDFLVPDGQWEQARKCLLEQGFTESGEEHDFHLSFRKGKHHLEMHHEPFGFEGEMGDELRALVPEMVENGVEVDTEFGKIRMCDSFGHGIVLLLHAYRHLVGAGVGVRHLCDWAVFIRRFTDEQFREIFEERFRALGIWRLAQSFGMASHMYLGIPYSAWMGEEKDLGEALMLDILDGGNFGRKESQRSAQNISIFEEGHQLTKKSGFMGVLRSFNTIAYERYEPVRKYKILRPFGWIAVGVRYLFRVITGKRKHVDLKKELNMGQYRKNYYSRLEIFKSEDQTR